MTLHPNPFEAEWPRLRAAARERAREHAGEAAVIVIVGAGPRGVGVLERIVANAPELFDDRPLEIHLVDPFPPGPGRVWRAAQSPLLMANSMAQDIALFADSTVEIEGPIRSGPTFHEWVQTAARHGVLGDSSLDDEAQHTTGVSFPTRRLLSAYLEWFYQQVVGDLPDAVSVEVHNTRVTTLFDGPGDRQTVVLDGRDEAIAADVVVLAQGHLDIAPDAHHAELARFADEHDLFYLPPAYSADADLDRIAPGANVVVRGIGLAFVDLLVLLTEGRGGRFHDDDDGTLVYEPSGREPRIFVGSRRGVPYHSKLVYERQGDAPELPRFFGPAAVDQLLADHDQLDFRRDIYPLIAKELTGSYYRELFTGHPERVTTCWTDFSERLTGLGFGAPELAALVDECVPDPSDRLDLEHLDRPLRGLFFGEPDAFQQYMRYYIADDISRRSDPRYSADLGVFNALLAVFGQLPRIIASGKLGARSRVDDIDGWWFGYFSYLASGPPEARLEQMLALSRAGLLEFLGAEMWVEADPTTRVFRAGSATVSTVVESTNLLEARLPRPSVARAEDDLVRRLHACGDGIEETLFDGGEAIPTGRLQVGAGDFRVIDRDGRAHDRRFALGSATASGAAPAFARPRTNALSFRQNDAVARTILHLLAELAVPVSAVPGTGGIQ